MKLCIDLISLSVFCLVLSTLSFSASAAPMQIQKGTLRFCGSEKCYEIQFEKASGQEKTWYLKNVQLRLLQKSAEGPGHYKPQSEPIATTSNHLQAPNARPLPPLWRAEMAIWELNTQRLFLNQMKPEVPFEQLFYLDLNQGAMRPLNALLD